MSDPLRIALVAEGPTDEVVIEAALRSMLADRPFVLNQLQPSGSVAFGEIGTGWVGVYRWCHQAAQRGNGSVATDELIFLTHDVLIVHLDADVASENYASGSITPLETDGELPCEEPCPPPSETTNRLREVLLSWCGEGRPPARTVICMPSKNTEAWVMAALFPGDRSVQQGIECFPNPQTRLGQQPKAGRISKRKHDYQSRLTDLEKGWVLIATPENLREAHRFQVEFLSAVPQLLSAEPPIAPFDENA